MKRFIYASALLVLIASPAFLQNRAVGQTPSASATTASGPDRYRAMLNTYCVGCHNARARTGGLALDGLDLHATQKDAQIWEKALRKLRGRLMPPPGSPQPPQADIDAFSTWMEGTLDTNPGPVTAGHVPHNDP